jgi:hypothetical protein
VETASGAEGIHVTNWNAEELTRIAGPREIRIAGRRADGTLRDPVIIWAVRVDDDLYVRSVRGTTGAWYRGTRATHKGWIRAAGAENDVTFEDVDPSDPVNERIDDAYRAKYGARSSSVTAINSPTARETTMKVLPR